jgi:cyclase
MLKTRLIPTLLWKELGLVKSANFKNSRRVGSALPAIKVYNSRDVDELILCDVDASSVGCAPNYSLVKEVAAECFVPLTVAGGISKLEHIEKLLECGADKVAINTSLFTNPELIDRASRQFGSQCLVASIDARRISTGWECMKNSGQVSTGKAPDIWARELVDRGSGEILITSIDRDGTMSGYDVQLIDAVCRAVNVPVIASGGAGDSTHMVDVLRNTFASAIAAASIFHFTETTPNEIKQELIKEGFPMRVSL